MTLQSVWIHKVKRELDGVTYLDLNCGSHEVGFVKWAQSCAGILGFCEVLRKCKDRTGGKCVHGCAINVRIYMNTRVSIRIGPLPHTFEVAIFFEVINNTIAVLIRIRYRGNLYTIFHLTGESCTRVFCDERPNNTHHESVSLEHGNFVDLTERTEKFAKILFFDAVG